MSLLEPKCPRCGLWGLATGETLCWPCSFHERLERDAATWAAAHPEQAACDHGIVFDEAASAKCSAGEVRRRWPRLHGQCPKGCGWSGIGYASMAHYIAGDW